MAKEKPTVVIDNGSGFLKAGLAGASEPSIMFPAIIGRTKQNRRRMSIAVGDFFVGEEAKANRRFANISSPLERGVVTNWEDMEKIWNYALDNELQVLPDEHPVLLTEHPLNPNNLREKTAETMFEKFQCPSLCLADTASLCLYASAVTSSDSDLGHPMASSAGFCENGLLTGVVLECGYGSTCAVPVQEGVVMREAVSKLDLGGQDLTVFLLRLVESRGYFFSPAQRELFADVKESLCYVAPNFGQEEDKVKQEKESLSNTLDANSFKNSGRVIRKCYEMLGDTLTIDIERSQCPEALFQPQWLRVDAKGVHKVVADAVEKCAVEIRNSLYDNVIVSGGCTLFRGFVERLEAELRSLIQNEAALNIKAPRDRRFLAWKGGSAFASSEAAKNKFITKQDFEEHGEAIVERMRGILVTKAENGDATADEDRQVCYGDQHDNSDHQNTSADPHMSSRLQHHRTTPGLTPRTSSRFSDFHQPFSRHQYGHRNLDSPDSSVSRTTSRLSDIYPRADSRFQGERKLMSRTPIAMSVTPNLSETPGMLSTTPNMSASPSRVNSKFTHLSPIPNTVSSYKYKTPNITGENASVRNVQRYHRHNLAEKEVSPRISYPLNQPSPTGAGEVNLETDGPEASPRLSAFRSPRLGYAARSPRGPSHQLLSPRIAAEADARAQPYTSLGSSSSTPTSSSSTFRRGSGSRASRTFNILGKRDSTDADPAKRPERPATPRVSSCSSESMSDSDGFDLGLSKTAAAVLRSIMESAGGFSFPDDTSDSCDEG